MSYWHEVITVCVDGIWRLSQLGKKPETEVKSRGHSGLAQSAQHLQGSGMFPDINGASAQSSGKQQALLAEYQQAAT